MDTIWTGKDGYDTEADFLDRTKKALGGDDRLFYTDVGKELENDPNVAFLHEQLKNLKPNVTFLHEQLENLNPDLLEVGCGYGRWSESLESFYEHYTGIDINEDRINYAVENYASSDVEFHKIQSCDWDLGKKFDVILSIKCLQHLLMGTAIDTLKIMSCHLKDDGVILLVENRMGYYTEEEANILYQSKKCPCHMIYKPIGLFEEHVSELEWYPQKNREHFIVKRK